MREGLAELARVQCALGVVRDYEAKTFEDDANGGKRGSHRELSSGSMPEGHSQSKMPARSRRHVGSATSMR